MPLEAGCELDYISLCDKDAGPEISVTKVVPGMKINTHLLGTEIKATLTNFPC